MPLAKQSLIPTLLFSLLMVTGPATAAKNRPNVVIMIDDLEYLDAAAYVVMVQAFDASVGRLDANLKRRCFPTSNPDYDGREGPCKYPFRDLRRELPGLTGSPELSDAMGLSAGRP